MVYDTFVPLSSPVFSAFGSFPGGVKGGDVGFWFVSFGLWVIIVAGALALGVCAVSSGRAVHPLARIPVRRASRALMSSSTATRRGGTACMPGRAGRRIVRHLGRVGRSTYGTSGRRLSLLGRGFCGLRGTRRRTTHGTFVSNKNTPRTFVPRPSSTRDHFGSVVDSVGRGEDTVRTRRSGRGRSGLIGGLTVVSHLGRLTRSPRSTGGTCGRFGGLRRR